jgi:CheY-like chemotaxis protein/anti-sigma regulatory factor (Ser/Thr protein kinase)
VTIRILVVDDVDDIRELVRYALGRHGGFEVIGEAATGGEAIALAKHAEPDIVLLDLGLPDITGQEVLTRLREVSTGSKVVIFTGQELSDHSFFDQYAAGFVTKGTDLRYLVGLLEDVGRTGYRDASAEFTADRANVPEARRFVVQQLEEWGSPIFADAAALVVSELATNAVVHANSSFVVRLKLSPAALRIEVTDADALTTPEPQPPSQTAEGGRGLLLVSAVSSSWGVEPSDEGGKLTWAELTGDE